MSAEIRLTGVQQKWRRGEINDALGPHHGGTVPQGVPQTGPQNRQPKLRFIRQAKLTVTALRSLIESSMAHSVPPAATDKGDAPPAGQYQMTPR
jgi:hypothetical protein